MELTGMSGVARMNSAGPQLIRLARMEPLARLMR